MKETKTAIAGRWMRIIASGKDVVPGTEDFDFLLALVRQHPRAAKKIGAGVKAFHPSVNLSRPYPTNCMYILRADGSREEVSYRKCLGWK
jgi:hypothetical protein